MAQRRPFDLTPPGRAPLSRVAWAALGASVVLHVLLLTLRVAGRAPTAPARDADVVFLMPDQSAREVPMPFVRPLVPAAPVAPGTARQPRPGVPKPVATVPPDEPPPPRPEEPPVVVEAPRPREVRDTTPAVARADGPLRPNAGGGKLWVRPLPLAPGELASRLRGGSGDYYRAPDSAVTAIIQRYLDSLATEVAANERLDSRTNKWTVRIGDRDYGLERGNIKVAGLTIPGALLGLLGMVGGNDVFSMGAKQGPGPYYEARRVDAMRRDLYEAVRRADNYTQFKQSIAEIRAAKQAEKDFERAQRTPPPPLPPEGASP